MTDLTSAAGERGLLGLAITEDGSLAYVNYTNNDGDTAIDEYAINADGTFDPATRREVLGFDQPYRNHNGGDLAFGPDDMLYIGTGDGGSGGDPDRRALNLGEWLGKMLRINRGPRRRLHGAHGQPVRRGRWCRPEIWVDHLRNPWRFSFDRRPAIRIADGPEPVEEVSVAWAEVAGRDELRMGAGRQPPVTPINQPKATPPIHEYEHGQRC
jgi:glucose/arabinose dehydrogenase